MRKRFTKIICFSAAVFAAFGMTVASACSNYKVTALKGNIFTDAEAVSNGGFAVEKGDYIYFINGNETYTADNEFGSVVKGAVMRISKDNLSARNYAETDTVVPQIAYSGNHNAGLFIYGDRIYYSTPSTEKNSDGEVLNSYLAFKSTKLDGTDTVKDYYMQYATNTVEYRYVEEGGVVYLVYVATSENLYGTSYTNLHSLNTETGVDTLLAYNVSSVTFDGGDVTNSRIYYTMNVTDFATGTSYSSYYNQIYTVRADATEPNSYDFSDVEDYDADEDPLYINCGTLVLDGIGKVQNMTDSVTQFNGEGADKVDTVPYTYTISGYEGGYLFYTRKSTSDSTEKLFAVKESELLSSSHKAVDNPDDTECLIRDGSEASSYNYVFDGNGELSGVIIAGSTGLVKAKVSDGKIPADIDNEGGSRYYLTKDGQATVLFTDGNYIYYSLTGGNGYTVYRIDYTGGYSDYNRLNLSGAVTDYSPVKILDLDSASDWYLPEMFDGQLLFATQTTNMTNYCYVMVCDLRKSGVLMTNAEIKELNEKYESVEETIADVDEEVYENLPNALRYVFYAGAANADYIDTLINAYVDIKGYSAEYFWSAESLAKYKAFAAATANGEWSSFSDTVKVNGTEVKSNTRDYYYALLGKMSDDDAEACLDNLKTTYLQAYPEEELSWFEGLSTGAKAGFIIGVCAGGLIVIAAAVIVTLVVIRKRKEKLPSYTKKRIKVDTTDDKDIDVYSDDK